MQSPAGSVAALSSAAATMFSVGMIFLGYWGLNEASPWHASDVVVVGLALFGFACLGSVPWIATSPAKADDETGLLRARKAFLVGVTAVWAAIAVSVVW